MKSSILTDRQQQELNKAIIQYLEPALDGDPETLVKLTDLLDLPSTSDENIVANYLEKKWSTVLRLQRKIIDLESEVSNLRTALDSQLPTQINSLAISNDKINWLPFSPTKTFSTLASLLVQACTLHPSLPVVFAGGSDGSLTIWNLVNDESSIPEKIIKAHTRSINKLAWSKVPIELTKNKPSYILASCSADLSIKLWDSNTYKHIRTLTGHEHTVSSLSFSHSDPNILYSVSRDKTVKVWDLANGFCVKTFVGHSEWVRDIDSISIASKILLDSIKPSEMGDFVLTCSNDQSIRLSHAASGTGLALLIGHTHVVEAVKFLPLTSNIILDKFVKDKIEMFPNISCEIVDDPVYTEILGYKYCISASRDNTVKLWLLPPPVIVSHRHPLPAKVNSSQGWLLADLVGHTSWVKAIGIHPNGRFIFSAGDDKTIKIWDLASLNIGGRVRCMRTLNGHEGFINDLDFAHFTVDKAMIEATKKADTAEEQHQQIMKLIETKMRCLLISGASDNTLRLWG